MKAPGKVALPTKDEQLSLNNTNIILKSNLTRLQLNEILSSVRDDDNENSPKRRKLAAWVEKVVDVLKGAAGRVSAETELSTAFLMEKGLHGFTQLPSGTEPLPPFVFKAPAAVQVIGSFPLGTATAPFLNCDVAVVLPASCFEARDILNHVYFGKKQLYLAALADALSSEGLCGSVQLSLLHGDPRKPHLVLQPAFKSRYSVRVFPCIAATTFKLTQLKPSKNNIRPSAWKLALQKRRLSGTCTPASATVHGGEMDPSSLPPTPFYNMAIMEDIALVPQFRILSKARESCPCFQDVCILLKVWLAKKNIRFGASDVGGHCLQMVVAYLFQTRQIGAQTTVLGALQVVMNFIAGTVFESTHLNFAGERKDNVRQGTWAATLLHPVGKDADAVPFNCLWRVSPSAIQALQTEATIAMKLLQAGSDTSFRRLFLEDVLCLGRYDMVFTMVVAKDGGDGVHRALEKTAAEEVACLDMTLPQYVCGEVYTTLTKALTNRTKIISATIHKRGSSATAPSSWDIETAPPTSEVTVRVGLVLDADHSRRKVDKGPSPIDDASALREAGAAAVVEFRSFWGPKCELRRFKDGTIVDAVVWSAADAVSLRTSTPNTVAHAAGAEMTGELVVEAISRYVLRRFLPDYGGNAIAVVGSLDHKLPEYGQSHASNEARQEVKPARVNFLNAVEALDKLRGILTSDMKDLPLLFESVSGLAPELRYTSKLPPAPQPMLLKSKELVKPLLSGQPLSLLTHPMLVVGVVEGGGKWPSDPVAARKMKTALLIRISSLLSKQFEIPSFPFEDHLDIVIEGYMFRLVLVFSTEVHICRLSRSLLSLSRHHHCVRTVNAAHSTFSPAVRLVNLWLSRNCFSGLIAHRSVELLVASVFTEVASYSHSPQTSAATFYRALDRLGRHDFDVSPLVVNLDSSSDESTVGALVADLHAGIVATGMMLLIVSTQDVVQQDVMLALADLTMEKAALSLMQARARHCAAYLASAVSLLDDSSIDAAIDHVFHGSSVTVEQQSNVVFRFQPCLSTKIDAFKRGPSYASVKIYANAPMFWCPERIIVSEPYCSSANGTQESVVRTLRERFSSVAVFFWDDTVGDMLYVVFKPTKVVQSMQFAPTNCKRKRTFGEPGTRPSGTEHVVVDIVQIVGDMMTAAHSAFSDVVFR